MLGADERRSLACQPRRRRTALAQSGDAARLKDSKHATPASAPPDCEICCRLVRNASRDAFPPNNALIRFKRDTAIAGRSVAAARNGKVTRKEQGREKVSHACGNTAERRNTQVSPAADCWLLGGLVGVFCSLSGTTRRLQFTLASNGESGHTEYRDQPSGDANRCTVTR